MQLAALFDDSKYDKPKTGARLEQLEKCVGNLGKKLLCRNYKARHGGVCERRKLYRVLGLVEGIMRRKNHAASLTVQATVPQQREEQNLGRKDADHSKRF